MQVTTQANYGSGLLFFQKNKPIGNSAMILSPLLFLVSEIFHPVSYSETTQELASVSIHYWQWFFAHILALCAILLLPFVILNLIRFIKERNIMLGYIGVSFAFLGIVGVSGLTAFDLMVWQMGANGSRELMVKFYDQLTQTPGFSIPFQLAGPLCLVIGIAILAIALFLSNIVKRWMALLIFCGILLYGLAGPLIPVANGQFIVDSGAVFMLIGLGSILFIKEAGGVYE